MQGEILAELPKVVQLLDGSETQRKIIHDVFVKLITPKVVSEPALGTETAAEKPVPLISPSELMIALHTMEDTIGLRRAVEGKRPVFYSCLIENNDCSFILV